MSRDRTCAKHAINAPIRSDGLVLNEAMMTRSKQTWMDAIKKDKLMLLLRS